jgi:hypothetical protein
MELQLLPSHKIDIQKWDECIKNSSNSLIYATSVYLDNMADNWDGIIVDDYAAVMPVAWRKKLGIKYSYHAPFIQQLGLFAENIDKNCLHECYTYLLQSYKYGDYFFNYKNELAIGQPCTNYILSLASNYRSISFFYDDKMKPQLEKAANNSFEYNKANADEVINLFVELYSKRIPGITQDDYKNFYSLCIIKEKENDLIARKVSTGEKNYAMNLLLKDRNRIYNLMSCVTTEGRKLFAGHFLYDNIIQEFSQTGLILDFEGSEIPGIAYFFKSLGGINQPYTKIHFNSFPKILQLLKR